MSSPTVRLRRWTNRVVESYLPPPRVLVVDDNANAADALATYLALAGIATRTAYGGRAALATWLEWRPNIVLLDISMPEVDGFAVARMVRADSRVAGTVVIALTAHDESFVSQGASSYEFDAYCQKGHMLTALSSLLDELLRATDKLVPHGYTAPKTLYARKVDD